MKKIFFIFIAVVLLFSCEGNIEKSDIEKGEEKVESDSSEEIQTEKEESFEVVDEVDIEDEVCEIDGGLIESYYDFQVSDDGNLLAVYDRENILLTFINFKESKKRLYTVSSLYDIKFYKGFFYFSLVDSNGLKDIYRFNWEGSIEKFLDVDKKEMTFAFSNNNLVLVFEENLKAKIREYSLDDLDNFKENLIVFGEDPSSIINLKNLQIDDDVISFEYQQEGHSFVVICFFMYYGGANTSFIDEIPLEGSFSPKRTNYTRINNGMYIENFKSDILTKTDSFYILDLPNLSSPDSSIFSGIDTPSFLKKLNNIQFGYEYGNVFSFIDRDKEKKQVKIYNGVEEIWKLENTIDVVDNSMVFVKRDLTIINEYVLNDDNVMVNRFSVYK